MQTRSRQELYRAFIDFVGLDVQKERSRANRRMLGVFLWCFLAPAVLSVIGTLLARLYVLPQFIYLKLDWMVLIFPIVYSLYFFATDVLAEVPASFKRGGLVTTLGQALKEGEWRDHISEGMRGSLGGSYDDWKWIEASYRMDLDGLLQRTRYMTALSGAVFFLLLKGIDWMTDFDSKKTVVVRNPLLSPYIEVAPNENAQFLALGMFLVLMYLSGTQAYRALTRYLHCVELIALKLGEERRS